MSCEVDVLGHPECAHPATVRLNFGTTFGGEDLDVDVCDFHARALEVTNGSDHA